jgi:hypothetical protein
VATHVADGVPHAGVPSAIHHYDMGLSGEFAFWLLEV